MAEDRGLILLILGKGLSIIGVSAAKAEQTFGTAQIVLSVVCMRKVFVS